MELIKKILSILKIITTITVILAIIIFSLIVTVWYMNYQMPVTVKNDRLFTLKHACFTYFVSDIRPVTIDAPEVFPLLIETIFSTQTIQENASIRNGNDIDKSLYSMEITNIRYEKIENFKYMEREKLFSKPDEKTISLGYKTTFDIEVKISEKVKFSEKSLIVSFPYPDGNEFEYDDDWIDIDPKTGISRYSRFRFKNYVKQFMTEEHFFKMHFIPLGISDYPYSPVNREASSVEYKVKVNNH